MSLTMEYTGVAPVIDIAPYFAGDATQRQRVAQQVAAACEYTGFYVVAGHGLDPAVLAETIDATREFFALPEADKLAIRPHTENGPGYRPMETVSLAATLEKVAPPDLKEGFLVSPLFEHRALPFDYVHTGDGPKWFRENQWPSAIPRFRTAWTNYYRSMESLSATLMEISALGLGLPADYFQPFFDRHTSQLTARNYPPVKREPKPGQLRAGEHTDYGALTILWKDPGSGSLQVVDKSGEWQDIMPSPDTLVINIGDLLARWTNDRWVSTLHRVAMPRPEAGETGPRLSIPFFCKPNFDAVIEVLDTCIDDAHPLGYGPIIAGEHMSMKRAKHVVRA